MLKILENINLIFILLEKNWPKEVINIKNKLLYTFILLASLIFINTIVSAKYIIEDKFDIANLNIDRTKPVIELVSITNTNTGYENYANKTHIIDLKFKITDKNFENVYCDKQHIKIKLNNEYIENENMTITNLQDLKEEKIYNIKLKNVEGNGKLTIEFIKGTAIDTSKLENDNVEFDTRILIDNIAPKCKFQEEKITNGKSKAIIDINEQIRNLDGWNLSSNKLKIEKEFTNNISYELPVVDYAGNQTMVNININQATYIKLIYGSHNSEVGWTFGYGNYDIAGKEAIKRNPLYKTEAIAFNFSGNVDSDFIQANAYVYTHWGEGTYGRDNENLLYYKYGYNPSKNTYKSMNSDDLVTINENKYFILGGNGINRVDNTDTNGNNKIPYETSIKYPYGVCGINMKLKDYSYYSIVYQILVDGAGWIQACSNGQECIYGKTKPMSAFRIALIPKTEEQYILNTWNKDIGTFNIN